MVFSKRPGNKTTEHAVENTEFNSAEKSTHISVAGEEHACVFLRSQWDSSLLIHCTRTNGKSTVLFGSTDKVTEIFSEEKTRTLAWFKWILHHDNAPVHDALRVCKFLAKNSITKLDHPPYPPDLAPCDFWLFPKLKKCPEGTKIWWPFWHPTQCENVTARYSGKRFSRLFPAVAPSHEVHSFTRRGIQRRQQPLVHW